MKEEARKLLEGSEAQEVVAVALVVGELAEGEALLPPYHFDLHEASRRLKISPPPVASVVEELRSMGFRASRTHFSPTGIKTDASYSEFLEGVLKALNRRQTR